MVSRDNYSDLVTDLQPSKELKLEFPKGSKKFGQTRSWLPFTLLSSAARTTSGSSDYVDVSNFAEMVALLDVTAASGTSPTLDVKFQTSDNGTDWFDLPSDAFTQSTAGVKKALKLSNFGRYVRASYTIGGTSPSFTFSLRLVAKT